ncbi:DMT family transporter [Tabrizicola sp.]|uniref:DMT family transporter n=1 Tax=Tabrizicola sp. TaxID=2005166 RepID=UPI00273767C2|nr:EamA family transporter [Tabrizicola sp.]MDP3195712.1 EamA family transporter [Tabrizicola sp.]
MQVAVRDGSAIGLLQIMAAAALWATVGVASRMIPASETLSDVVMGVARMAVGGPVILALAIVSRQDRFAAFRRLDLQQLLAFAAGCAVFQVCLFRAFTLLGVTATVFVTVCLPPLLACGWSAIRGSQPVSRVALLALGLAAVGLAMFAVGHGQVASPQSLVPGLGLALAASIAFVVMTESARDMTREVGPLIVVGAGLTLAGIMLLLGLVLLDPQSIAPPAQNGWKTVALVIYLGLGPTALAYVIYCSGVARCRSAGVGLIASMVEPGLAAVLAWLVLSERLGSAELIGCAMVSGAMLILWWSERAELRG